MAQADGCPEARVFFDRHILSVMIEGEAPFGRCETFYRLKHFTTEWMPKEVARGFLRDLTERGYCQYRNGLFTEDGEVAGSGYGVTERGVDYYREISAPSAN